MIEKYDALMENKAWIRIDLPPKYYVIQCKWVYKLKYNTDGNINHYKTCLMAKGFS
jgi:hypothetical protein